VNFVIDEIGEDAATYDHSLQSMIPRPAFVA